MEESLIIRYRKNASYCRVQAARARDANHKARWLEFAKGWEMLADKASQEAILRIGLSNDTGARGLDIGHHYH
jgi:hypothetical protein